MSFRVLTTLRVKQFDNDDFQSLSFRAERSAAKNLEYIYVYATEIIRAKLSSTRLRRYAPLNDKEGDADKEW